MISTQGGKVQVQFVDYGNYDDVKPWEVKELLEEFFTTPAHAFPCAIFNCTPTSGSWPREAITLFRKLTEGEESEADQPIVGLVVSQLADGTFALELIDRQNRSVIETMRQKGYVTPSGTAKKRAPVITKRSVTSPPSSTTTQQREAPKRAPVVKIDPRSTRTQQPSGSVTSSRKQTSRETNSSSGRSEQGAAAGSVTSSTSKFRDVTVRRGDFLDVEVVFIVTPGEFYIQLTKHQAALNETMTDLQKGYNLSSPSPALLDPQPGTPCCAFYDEDERWYREIGRAHV